IASLLEREGRDCHLVEYGCGNTQKAATLLSALRNPGGYLGIDLSSAPLLASCDRVSRTYPRLVVTGLRADITRPLELPVPPKVRNVAFFPGSSIGNFEPKDAALFLKNVGASMGPGGALVIGVDLKKDPALLHAAYNDAEGVTAAFNRNLLERMNRECGA